MKKSYRKKIFRKKRSSKKEKILPELIAELLETGVEIMLEFIVELLN